MNESIDYSAYRNQIDADEDYYDESFTLAENLAIAFSQVIKLPHYSVQAPVMLAYSLIPSAMATVVPILALLGAKGSGKSTAMKLIATLHSQTILSAATSAVAIRNHINASRSLDPLIQQGEMNTCLLFDNVTVEAFKNEFLYLYFLNGYDRATDTIMISAGGQQNYNFRVFSPKVISTVHSFLSERQFEELARRCVVIRFKPLEQLEESEQGSNPPVPVETLNLSTFKRKYDEFWQEPENLESYASAKKKLLKRRRKNTIPPEFNSTKWTISVDLLATGCAVGMWDIDSGLTILSQYWQWYELEGKPGLSPLQMLLSQLIHEECNKINGANLKYGEGTLDLEISITVYR